ncbi:hypothetical protein Indivirus_1_72 [Indivirus ILV1]|uniref:Uncharacterized protein n=1 Tax=Indivirus ILV1 TaxID=1977633 RepID=A0A1V0SCL1_9VIRU|nr:hypothetical protein Indivirus_1_72 [Indivirus ILV1]
MSYKLINPSIEGQLKTTFKAKSSLDAANKAWTSVSKYISNNVPKFAFTLENTKDGSLSHFIVKEKLDGKNASFNISKLKVDSDSKKEEEFKNRIAKQAGGKKHRKHSLHASHDSHKEHDDSSSSSSSSSSDVKLISPFSPFGHNYWNNTPISYWYYDPYFYNLDSLFIPTFVYPLTPYVEITTLNYYPY